MTGLPNSFTARGPVTLKPTLALPTKKLGRHEIETTISSAYEN